MSVRAANSNEDSQSHELYVMSITPAIGFPLILVPIVASRLVLNKH